MRINSAYTSVPLVLLANRPYPPFARASSPVHPAFYVLCPLDLNLIRSLTPVCHSPVVSPPSHPTTAIARTTCHSLCSHLCPTRLDNTPRRRRTPSLIPLNAYFVTQGDIYTPSFEIAQCCNFRGSRRRLRRIAGSARTISGLLDLPSSTTCAAQRPSIPRNRSRPRSVCQFFPHRCLRRWPSHARPRAVRSEILPRNYHHGRPSTLFSSSISFE